MRLENFEKWSKTRLPGGSLEIVTILKIGIKLTDHVTASSFAEVVICGHGLFDYFEGWRQKTTRIGVFDLALAPLRQGCRRRGHGRLVGMMKPT